MGNHLALMFSCLSSQIPFIVFHSHFQIIRPPNKSDRPRIAFPALRHEEKSRKDLGRDKCRDDKKIKKKKERNKTISSAFSALSIMTRIGWRYPAVRRTWGWRIDLDRNSSSPTFSRFLPSDEIERECRIGRAECAN